MTTLEIRDNLWAYVSGKAEELERLLRYRQPGYRFATAYQKGYWDGWNSLIKVVDGERRFPAGLVPYVLEQPWSQAWTKRDFRQAPEAASLFNYETRVGLDPHQENAVDASRTHGRGIVKYPTGTGKGRIIGEVIRSFDQKTLVIVDKIDLLTQLQKEIKAATGSKHIGVIGGGRFSFDDVSIATFQSLDKRLNNEEFQDDVRRELASFGCVLVDEVQHAAAKTFEKVLQNVPAYYRIGFSATPFNSYAGKSTNRGNFLRVQAWLGPPIAELSIEEGIDTKRIVRPDIYVVHGAGTVREVKPRNFSEEYNDFIVHDHTRNATIVQLAKRLRKKGPTVILVDRVEHGDHLAALIGCPFVSGSTKDRQTIYEAFKRGAYSCLVISKIADEALDLPNIVHLILAGGGKADHRQVQRIGRAMRASEGKERCMVFDFEDYGEYLAAHSRRRIRLYEREEAYNVIHVSREALFNAMS